MSGQKPQRRWFQFSLRTLLVITAAAAGLAFAWMKTVEPYRLQRQAIAVITKLGGTYKTEDATGWVRYLDKNAQDVVVADLADCDEPDEYLPHLLRLLRLRTLVVGGHSVGDEQVAALGRVGSLRGLVLDSTLVSDVAVEGLKDTLPDVVVWKSERRAVKEVGKLGGSVYYSDFYGFKEWATRRPDEMPPDWLRQEVGDSYCEPPFVVVDLGGTQAVDGDLAWIAALSNLQVLSLDNTLVTDDGLSWVARCKSLTRLQLNGTQISDRGVCWLQKCSRLTALYLNDTKITDKSILHLEHCTRLALLHIRRTGISSEAVEGLTAALPQCDIRP